MNIKYLIEKYQTLSVKDRLKQMYKDFYMEDILITSSFGTSSAVLLSQISQVNPHQPIHFIDTTYLFEETHKYKEDLMQQFRLKLITITPEQWKNEFTTKDETWEKDPDLCCSVNKVEPLNRVKKQYKVWVSGLMGYQAPTRKNLELFEVDGDIIKFYPLIDIEKDFVEKLFIQQQLPKHPLESKGYSSIGCTHCTSVGNDREGRWHKFNKVECGLHVKKDKPIESTIG